MIHLSFNAFYARKPLLIPLLRVERVPEIWETDIFKFPEPAKIFTIPEPTNSMFGSIYESKPLLIPLLYPQDRQKISTMENLPRALPIKPNERKKLPSASKRKYTKPQRVKNL